MQTTQAQDILPSLLKQRRSSVLFARKSAERRSVIKGSAEELPPADTNSSHDALLGATVQKDPEFKMQSEGLHQRPLSRSSQACGFQVLLDAKVQKESETELAQLLPASPPGSAAKARRASISMGLLQSQSNNASMPRKIRRMSCVRMQDDPNLARGQLMLEQFAFFRNLPEKIKSKMLSLVQYASKPTGSLLFQQGDPAGDVYIILSGAIGILVASQTSSVEAEGPQAEGEEEDDAKDDQDEDGDDDRRSEAWEENQAEWGRFGTQVAVLGKGSLVGEQAIIKGLPRNASGICKENTEVLFISKLDFERSLMDDMAGLTDEKQYWLETHVPGIRELNQNRLEFVLLNFKMASFPKGHKFIEQGTLTASKNEQVYLLRKGEVEIQHNAGVDARGRTATLGILVKGGFFGSMADGTPEPFSLVVSKAPCELLVASGANYRRLPMSLKQSLREHVQQSSRWRLQQTLQASCVSTKIFPEVEKCIVTSRAFTHMSSHAKRQHMRRCSSLPTGASFGRARSHSGLPRSSSHRLLPEIPQENSRSTMLKIGRDNAQ
eukprot:TRINITY_DN59900_c0_g1_i1.p1 TRINITY_DN59900_c0_g1~~TRINITY_DN59900_c0_g1_i1.p1  ORF type:complete len:591 (+),score=95.40 TRINITY_DN59900_c0_g1_i1:122-1774(+)